MAYIIGTYNKYNAWDRAHTVYKFIINNNWYGIKRVEMEWGTPIIMEQVDRNDAPEAYYIYETVEEAMKFVNTMK